ncbi:MAG: type I 3-dehydroquinate dehydratase [Thermoplasmata archaeon]|nr:type I 3-dehydroquinate dehydratase [Thermoplasmata archaeon]
MSPTAPLIVASLSGRTAESCRTQGEAAAREGADWAEIRIDRWSEDARAHLMELFPAPLPLLATLRSRAEGGAASDVPEEREETLRRALELPFVAVDLEVRRDLCLDFVRAARPSSLGTPRLVFSAHLPEGTTASELRRLIAEPLPVPGVRKLVLPASVARSVIDLLPLVDSLPDPRPTVLTTGPSGPLFRLWAPELRMPLVYGSLSGHPATDAVEPSQLPVAILRRLQRAGGTRVLLGLLGSPLGQSPSPTLFERWFATQGEAATYVPIELSDGRVLGVVLESLAARGFRGVNLTHPLKLAAHELNAVAGIEARRAGCANFVVFGPDGWRTENTDARAMRRRLSELEAQRGGPFSSVLIYGTGGAARATLAALEPGGRPVALLGRSPAKISELGSVSGREPEVPDRASYDLVVNATTSGRAGVEPLPPTWLSRIGKGSMVLDWVYRPAVPALELCCAERGAHYEEGSRLLLYPAAESYREWFGRPLSSAEEQVGWEA